MPRKPSIPSLSDRNAAPGGVAAVDRALSVLSACGSNGSPVSLSELASRTGLYKSTVLRLLASLEHGGLVRRGDDGRYALGPQVARLNAAYVSSFSLQEQVVPVLERLVNATQESAAFHVRQGAQRVCLYRVDSPHPIRDHIRPGDLLPLDRGAGGRVLLAWAGEKGEIYDQIRRDKVVVLVGDRVPELVGIAAPVFGTEAALIGSITVTMPRERLVARYTEDVRAAAAEMTARCGGVFPE